MLYDLPAAVEYEECIRTRTRSELNRALHLRRRGTDLRHDLQTQQQLSDPREELLQHLPRRRDRLGDEDRLGLAEYSTVFGAGKGDEDVDMVGKARAHGAEVMISDIDRHAYFLDATRPRGMP